MAQAVKSEFMSVSDAAAYVGVTKQYIYQCINDGKLEAYEIYNRLVLRRTDVTIFAQRRREKARDGKY